MTKNETKTKSAYAKAEDTVITAAVVTIAVCWTVDLVKRRRARKSK